MAPQSFHIERSFSLDILSYQRVPNEGLPLVRKRAPGHVLQKAGDGSTGLMDEQDEVTDRAYARILGQEIRRAREARGWTRVDLADRLPSGIGDRTLLSYEHGVRHLTVVRFVEISRALGIAAHEILQRASEKARDLTAYSLRVNLHALARDERDGYEKVRSWAKTRVEKVPAGILLLNPFTVREIAYFLGFTHGALTAYLAEFTTEDIPED
jgi:transcriptional regulator with XRE-family HTH domain